MSQYPPPLHTAISIGEEEEEEEEEAKYDSFVIKIDTLPSIVVKYS